MKKVTIFFEESEPVVCKAKQRSAEDDEIVERLKRRPELRNLLTESAKLNVEDVALLILIATRFNLGSNTKERKYT